MISYKVLSNIMYKFFNNQVFHQQSDILLKHAQSKKNKMKYPCELQQTILIDNKTFIFHHYKRKHKKVLLYFPGGSFLDPPTILHYKFAKKIAKKLKLHIIMIQYPLFPESDPLTTALLIKRIVGKLNINSFYVMGDSAGANLAFFVLYVFQQENLNIINKTILISPFVNMDLNNEEILTIRDEDFVLSYLNLKDLVKNVYSKYIHDDLYIIPHLKDFKYKSDVLVVAGEKEILSPDIKKWINNKTNLKIKYLLYKNMCHCFPILPIKEANHFTNKMKNFINNIDI